MALYRKYRPATFADVVGQEQVTRPLSVALDSGRINHAYLFSGPRGCGKTSSARILARSLNCVEGPTSTPCGVCPSCVSLAPGGPGNLDVTELDAASHRGVDDMRELRDRAYFAPAESRYRVFIIDEAHMITREGSNALLKIVEEPPEHLIFIFATTEPEKVIGTIRSRTHHYPFRLLTPAAMRGLIERTVASEDVVVEDSVYPLIIRAGGGSPRDTLSLLDQLLAGAGPEGLTYDLALPLLGVTDLSLIDAAIDALADGDRAALFTTVDEVIEAGHEPRRFVEDLLDRLRDLMVLQAVPEALDMGLVDAPTDRAEVLRAEAARFTAAQLAHLAATVNERIADMRGATSPRLLLEILCAHLLLPAPQAGGAGAVAQATAAPPPVGSAPAAPADQPAAGGAPSAGQRVFERRSQRLAREAAEKAAAEKAAAEQAAAADAAAAEAAAEPAESAVPTAPAAPETAAERRPEQPQPAPTVESAQEGPAAQSTPGAPTTPQEPQVASTRPSAQPDARRQVTAPQQSEPVQQPSQPASVEKSRPPAAPAAPSTPPSSPNVPPADSAEDLVGRIRSGWAQLRSAIGRRNKVAEIMLTEARVLGLREDTLVLGHNTGALAERLNAPTNNEAIVAVLTEEFERPLKVHCVVGTDPAAAGFPAPSRRPATWNPNRETGSPDSTDSTDSADSSEESERPAPPENSIAEPAMPADPGAGRNESGWGQPAPLGGQRPDTGPRNPQPAPTSGQEPQPTWGKPAALGGAPDLGDDIAAGSGTGDVVREPSHSAPARPQQADQVGEGRPQRNWEAAAARGESKMAERATRPAFDNGVPLPPEPDDGAAYGAPPPPDPYDSPGTRAAPPARPAPAQQANPGPGPGSSAVEVPSGSAASPETRDRNEEEEEMAEAARQPGNYDRRDATTIAMELLEQELGARRL